MVGHNLGKREWVMLIAAGMAAGVGGCRSGTSPQPVGTRPAAGGGTAGGNGVVNVSAQDLRDLLADMAKAHEDKIKLGTWAGTLVLPVAPPFKPFFANMHKQNKELLAELKAWAKKHKVDVTFHYTDDVDGRALKMMDDRQEKIIRGDDQQNFERDILMEMASDYDWHLCQARALLPNVQDGELRDYLQKSIAMLDGGAQEIRGLLKRYKFQ